MLFNNKVALIVDDSFTIRHQVKLLLKKNNITVLEASDEKSMVNYLYMNNKPVDLIIMDLGLKETTGFELMKLIRSKNDHKHTPIIVLTGDAKKQTVLSVIKYKVSYYVIKPIQPLDLLNKVQVALQKGENQQFIDSESLQEDIEEIETSNLSDISAPVYDDDNPFIMDDGQDSDTKEII